MKKVLVFFLCLSISFNSAAAVFASAGDGARVKAVITAESSAMAKLLSSVSEPMGELSRQLSAGNPFIPNLVEPDSGQSAPRAVCAAITIPADNKLTLIKYRGTTPQGSVFGRFNPELFAAQQVFPPPGLRSCVNSNFLSYLVFLAKSNLPWAAVYSCVV